MSVIRLGSHQIFSKFGVNWIQSVYINNKQALKLKNRSRMRLHASYHLQTSQRAGISEKHFLRIQSNLFYCIPDNLVAFGPNVASMGFRAQCAVVIYH